MATTATPTREESLHTAKLMETAERYDEMVDAIRAVAVAGQGLNEEERNLFASAYKHVINARRSSAKMILGLEKKQGDADSVGKIREFRDKVESELSFICHDLINVVEKNLLPKADTNEAKVYYYKMVGDYWRYLAEFATGDNKATATSSCEAAYKKAQELAQAMPATHPLRLGIALNLSVFYFEVIQDVDKACDLAQQAFDAASDNLSHLDDASRRESTKIIALLRDNLMRWAEAGL